MPNKRYCIYNEDVIKWAGKFKGEKFHALLCDAPYHLITTVKRFSKADLNDDTITSKRVRNREDGFARLVATGFMGSDWDGVGTDGLGVSFRPETWAALGEHLYPGAFGITFGGSRTAHRVAVAIEDAGFIIHPMIGWIYGSGFPKATRVKGHKEFAGHRYGLQALKPALEPIIIFQKPYDGKPVDNIILSGAGALNIDAGRIALQDGDGYEINTFDDGAKPFGHGAGHKYTTKRVAYKYPKGAKGLYSKNYQSSSKIASDWNNFSTSEDNMPIEGSELGRWPANFILDDVVAPVLDKQSGHLKSGKPAGQKKAQNNIYGKYGTGIDITGIGDEGGASRFFYQVNTQLDAADPFIYQKKASPKERNVGLDERNDHPTVKPIDLNKYLASLLLPPVDYAPRRLLVPFSGVASEMIGALLAGWEYVEGIELGEHYCELGEKRIHYWLKQRS